MNDTTTECVCGGTATWHGFYRNAEGETKTCRHCKDRNAEQGIAAQPRTIVPNGYSKVSVGAPPEPSGIDFSPRQPALREAARATTEWQAWAIENYDAVLWFIKRAVEMHKRGDARIGAKEIWEDLRKEFADRHFPNEFTPAAARAAVTLFPVLASKIVVRRSKFDLVVPEVES